MAVLRRIRSKMTEEVEPALPPKPDESISTGDGDIPGEYAERYPINLSGRSRAARSKTLADQFWKRSNTSGDMLKHTDQERSAARIRRGMRSRLSLPSEVTIIQDGRPPGEHKPNADPTDSDPNTKFES
ncbi:hypothetical protein V7S43_011808 [Phytophthora oleae]|uniref:Uncharacterized protein n=1 Tax=Phytophthora oleae TaxID=2107226 RepID=A0ABD3F9K4_9STRA